MSQLKGFPLVSSLGGFSHVSDHRGFTLVSPPEFERIAPCVSPVGIPPGEIFGDFPWCQTCGDFPLCQTRKEFSILSDLRRFSLTARLGDLAGFILTGADAPRAWCPALTLAVCVCVTDQQLQATHDVIGVGCLGGGGWATAGTA